MVTDETKILYALLGYGLATGIFIANFLLSSFRQKKLNSKLHREKTEVEIVTLERERKRLANDLHDDVAPLATAVLMQLESMRPTTQLQVREIKKTKRLVNELLRKVRESSDNLLPADLVECGLYEVMQSLRDDIESTGKLKVRLLFDKKSFLLPPEKEVHLYRMFKEAVHNCLQHAKASTFTLQVRQTQRAIEIDMRDDGVGFDYPNMKRSEFGYGLSSIANRVDMLNGDFYLNTKPGKGTRLQISIPIKPLNHAEQNNTGDC
jgi:two-component system NarL family sensor kinase